MPKIGVTALWLSAAALFYPRKLLSNHHSNTWLVFFTLPVVIVAKFGDVQVSGIGNRKLSGHLHECNTVAAPLWIIYDHSRDAWRSGRMCVRLFCDHVCKGVFFLPRILCKHELLVSVGRGRREKKLQKKKLKKN